MKIFSILRMVTGKKVLAVGAHPDDIEMGCGGTLLKHILIGDEVFALILTDGEKGGHARNRKECIVSLIELGIKRENIFFGNFPDGYVQDDQRTVNFVEEIINRYGITRIFTHSSKDRHQDHRHCSQAVAAAARKTQEIFLFEGPSTLVPFEPHYFVDLEEEHMKRKIECLKKYETQMQKNIVNIRAIEQLGGVIGSKHGSLYAEAFEINHILKKENEV